MNKKVKVIITILMISITFTPIIFYGYQKYEIKKYKTLNLENDKNNAYVHFSIDDCINIFYDLDKNQDFKIIKNIYEKIGYKVIEIKINISQFSKTNY